MKKSHLFLSLAFISGGIGYIAMNQPPEKPQHHAAAIIDNSDSVFERIACDALPKSVIGEMKGIEYGEGSQFSLYSLGRQESSFEPVPTLETLLPPPGGEGIFSQGNFDGDVVSACKTITQVGRSSIFRAVEVTLAHLRGLNAPATLVVQTDLAESVSREFLKGGKAGRLENAGVTVVFCNYAVTAEGGPRGDEVNMLIERWQQAFTDPARVSFRPYCAGAETKITAR